MYRDLGTVISKTARKNRCSVVTSYCGHGCHELFHTAPNVPHYSRNKAVGTMKVGHSFTIEPMINRGLCAVHLAACGASVVLSLPLKLCLCLCYLITLFVRLGVSLGFVRCLW